MLEIVLQPAYLSKMSFKNDVSPIGAVRDIFAYFREDRPLKPFLVIASCIPPVLLFFMISQDATEKSVPPPPTVTYFESWPIDRSIEETKASIAERQKLKDALMEKQRQSYKALGRAVGMDVEKIEREANELREQAARAEANKKAQDNAKQSKADAARSEVAVPDTAGPEVAKSGAAQ
jgi:hypothetical protein